MPQANNNGQDVSASPSLNLWIITDHKPGHLNQLKGLCERIAAHTGTHEHWISTEDTNTRWLDCLLRRYPTQNQPLLHDRPAPDIVIGAGHSTHKEVLAIKRHFRCFSVLLMNPSLPVQWFDAAIIPEHDNPTPRDHTLVTKGVLNTITPINTPAVLEANQHKGLILIGGDSKHYDWDAAEIVQQVVDLAHKHEATQWTLSDSRRTGPAFISLLKRQLPKNLKIIPHTETPQGWVKEQMAEAGTIWVTPDSVSMVYEAITSGVPVGLFNMTAKKNGRIVKGIQSLVEQGIASTFATGSQTLDSSMPKTPLWEAERAAVWLLEQYAKYKKRSADK